MRITNFMKSILDFPSEETFVTFKDIHKDYLQTFMTRGEDDHYIHEIIFEICDDQPSTRRSCTIYHPHKCPIVRPPVGSMGKLVGEYKKRFNDLAKKGRELAFSFVHCIQRSENNNLYE